MSNGTITQQGKFTSTGVAKTLNLRMDPDWVEVINYTTSAAGGAGTGVKFYWQRGMADDTGFEWQKIAADQTITQVVMATGGFTLIDTSGDPLCALQTTGTGINGTTTAATATSTTGLIENSIIRLINPVGALQLGGLDFAIDTVVANTSFNITYLPTVIVNGTTFSFRKVKWDPIFYPRSRYITSISKAASAVVITTVPHGYVVGQVVKFNVGTEYGMTEINGLYGTITAINTATNTFTVDIDSTGFTTYAWPLSAVAAAGVTPATITPIGAGSSMVAAGGFGDAQVNQAQIGMVLAAGVDSPAGVNTNVIYWKAGKSLDVDNT